MTFCICFFQGVGGREPGGADCRRPLPSRRGAVFRCNKPGGKWGNEDGDKR